MGDEPGNEKLADALASVERDGPQRAAELFPLLYRELHRMAQRQLQRNGSMGALGATSLLHEAYLNLCARTEPFLDRGRFFAYAARAMRGLIIDYVRARCAVKRGGEFQITSLATEGEVPDAAAQELEVLDGALLELAEVEPELAELVDLKFFCGFSFEEIATMRGISRRTLYRDWSRARIFLRGALAEE